MTNRRRCAIYTRKSTEEGLEQDFNSLDAQREACSAYILSQAHEGWEASEELYDDGGFSGGSMDRPALRRLLADIEAGRIDIIVVYKVDRLTRSLADFAKIVEILDANGASFVSVTQAFNTTTSMGRLTLNVLLSFAQFEREVTGERIRDKIAASKKKGMWMGGPVPIGYDCRDRRLIVDESEAATVRYIFERYAALRSIPKLVEELARSEHRTKRRVYKSGRVIGGVRFAPGPLSHLLRNRIYVGEVSHKDQSYPGEHDPIIDRALFDEVQDILAGNRRDHRIGANIKVPSLLSGILTDPEGRPMAPVHTSKGSKRYRYYVSRLAPGDDKATAVRIPARELERMVIDAVTAELADAPPNEKATADAIVEARKRAAELANQLAEPTISAQREALLELKAKVQLEAEAITISLELPWQETRRSTSIPARLVRRGADLKLVTSPGSDRTQREPDPVLLRLVAHGVAAREMLVEGKNRPMVGDYSRRHLNRLVKISYLAPDIIAAIVAGAQPPQLTGRTLLRMANMPLDWDGQRKALGF